MSAFKMIIRINPAPGQDDAFNHWYDEHLRHVLSVPGFVSAERFVVSDIGQPRAFRYVTIFDVSCDDIHATMADLQARVADGRITLSPTMDPVVQYEVVERIA